VSTTPACGSAARERVCVCVCVCVVFSVAVLGSFCKYVDEYVRQHVSQYPLSLFPGKKTARKIEEAPVESNSFLVPPTLSIARSVCAYLRAVALACWADGFLTAFLRACVCVHVCVCMCVCVRDRLAKTRRKKSQALFHFIHAGVFFCF